MKLETLKDFEDVYILARYFYRVGREFLPDAVYDELHGFLVKEGRIPEYTQRTYDDDPVPILLLQKYGYENTVSLEKEKRDTSFLAEEKSTSIRKVSSMEEVYQFFQRFPEVNKFVSIKLDGNNVKSEVEGNDWKLSLTRGRDSNGFDVTDAMLQIQPKHFFIPGHIVLTGEVFVAPRNLEYLRQKYDSGKYKTTRTAAITMLRKVENHCKEDYQFLEFYAYRADGISSTVHGTYELLEKAGLKVPPHKELEKEPDNFEDFCSWFQKIMDELYEKQKELGLPADGLVVELDDYDFQTDIKDQYDERQIAVKFSHWDSNVYEGTIISIIMEQRRVFCCCKVGIAHMLTADGCSATTINVFNPSFLLDFGLNIGSKILFERQAGTVNILVNGKKVKVNNLDFEE